MLAVVIPCFRVKRHVLDVLHAIPAEVDRVYVVDDACPDGSGTHVQAHCSDPRVRVLVRNANGGVGAAMITGYRAALADGASIVVKLDGDGQMDPGRIPELVASLAGGYADYAKGNRFFDVSVVEKMPLKRLIGNALLTFLAKASTGYWNLFDPTNGYTAIHSSALSRLPLDKISGGYFFETDMLFRLRTIGAVIDDVPMDARYGDERSNLRVRREALPFLAGHVRNLGKRLLYGYFLRDFSLASVQLLLGLLLLAFGLVHGGWHWFESITSGVAATAGTVIISAVTLLAGLQLLLAFLAYDMASIPRLPLQRLRQAVPR